MTAPPDLPANVRFECDCGAVWWEEEATGHKLPCPTCRTLVGPYNGFTPPRDPVDPLDDRDNLGESPDY